MAVRIDNAADRLLRTTDLLSYNAAYTWMFWVYLVSDLNAASTLIAISDDTTANNDHLRTASDGVTLDLRVVNGGDVVNVTGSALTVGVWYHIALVRESVTSLKLYLNGVLDITNTGDVTGRAAATRLEFGAFRSTNVQRSDSRFAAIKAFSAGLVQSEVQNGMYSVIPRRYSNLYGWWPCFPGATERLRDYSVNARNWTASGTLTDEAGPPIGWGLYAPFYPEFAAGGITEEADLTLARFLAISQLGEANTQGLSTLARLLAISEAGQANTQGAASLGRTLATDLDNFGAFPVDTSLARFHGLATSVEALAEAEASLSKLLGVSQTGQADTHGVIEAGRELDTELAATKTAEAASSLNRFEAISQSGQATAEGEQALSRILGVSEAGQADTQGLVEVDRFEDLDLDRTMTTERESSLDRLLSVSQAGQASTQAASSLDKFLGATLSATAEALAEIGLSLIRLLVTDGEIDEAGAVIEEADLSLGRSLSMALSGDAVAQGIISTLVNLGVSVSSQVDIQGLVSLSRSEGFTADRLAETPASISLTLNLSSALSGQAEAGADLSLLEELATGYIAQAAALAELELEIIRLVVLDGVTVVITFISSRLALRIGDRAETGAMIGDQLVTTLRVGDYLTPYLYIGDNSSFK